MLPQSATITCMRGDPLHAVLRVIGVDLTGARLAFGVGLHADPLGRQWVLGMAEAKGADGIRLVRVDQTAEGLPMTICEIIAGKVRVDGLPRDGVPIGCDALYSFDLQTDRLNIGDDLSEVETTLLRGTLIVKGSIND